MHNSVTIPKNGIIIYFEWVSFMAYESDLDKAVFKKSWGGVGMELAGRPGPFLVSGSAIPLSPPGM